MDGEYPDIAPRIKEIGARKNKLADDGEMYTLPVLSDAHTNALITDSREVAEYLGTTHPEKPNFSKDLILVSDAAVFDLARAAITFPSLRASQVLNERSTEYFIT
ncbi:hypothetical protein BKA83DRAFT_4491111 [Pisolithus microcarpus]|nr:hypothetical protein BKA83DRAFT_4491111 [Pisolithus microcarpus]